MGKANKKILNKIVEILKQELNPSRIFLFGSQANGTAHEDSDYDFVVVTKNSTKWSHEARSRLRSLIRNEAHVSADVFVYSEKAFAIWKDEFSSIPEVALNTGRELEL
jgi:uncharacterized protein